MNEPAFNPHCDVKETTTVKVEVPYGFVQVTIGHFPGKGEQAEPFLAIGLDSAYTAALAKVRDLGRGV